MIENTATPASQKSVTPTTIKLFDSLIGGVEDEVLQQCLSCDQPQLTMGPEAEVMIKTGLGFFSKMLRSLIVLNSSKNMEDGLTWAKTCIVIMIVKKYSFLHTH